MVHLSTMKKSLPFALPLLLLAACSSDEPGPDAAGNKLRTETGFCTEWARVACHPNVLDACESDEDGCTVRQRTFCEDLVPTGYAPNHAEDCIQAVKTAYSDATLTAEEAAVVLNLGGDCARLVNGGRGEGETCSDSFQCDTIRGYECVIKPGDIAGECHIPEARGGGERCSDPSAVCDEGFFCDGEDCLSTPRDPCTNDAMCEDDSVCVIPTDETEGTCEPKLALREMCSTDSECESNFCVNGTCRSEVDLSLDTPFCSNL
jgi:hypothetical protein